MPQSCAGPGTFLLPRAFRRSFHYCFDYPPWLVLSSFDSSFFLSLYLSPLVLVCLSTFHVVVPFSILTPRLCQPWCQVYLHPGDMTATAWRACGISSLLYLMMGRILHCVGRVPIAIRHQCAAIPNFANLNAVCLRFPSKHATVTDSLSTRLPSSFVERHLEG